MGDTLYIVRSGRLRVYASDVDGRTITYGLYGPGDYVGEMSLDGGPRSASVEAAEKCTVVAVSRALLRQHLRDDPEFAFELMTKLIFRLRMLTLRTRDMALHDVYGRLANLLNRLAVEQPDGSRLTPDRMTHLQLSELLGCSRAMVTRLLNGLERNGCLRQERQRYRLLRALPARW